MEPKTIELLLKIISDRANWWSEKVNETQTQSGNKIYRGAAIGERTAYQSVESMLMYALNDDIEALSQFDYYGKDA